MLVLFECVPKENSEAVGVDFTSVHNGHLDTQNMIISRRLIREYLAMYAGPLSYQDS